MTLSFFDQELSAPARWRDGTHRAATLEATWARFAPLAAGFWGVWTVGVVLAVLGASVWQHNAAAIWGGGLLALAAGLVVGHLVNHSADSAQAPGAGLH